MKWIGKRGLSGAIFEGKELIITVILLVIITGSIAVYFFPSILSSLSKIAGLNR